MPFYWCESLAEKYFHQRKGFFSPRFSQNPMIKLEVLLPLQFLEWQQPHSSAVFNSVESDQASSSGTLTCFLGDMIDCVSADFTAAKLTSHLLPMKSPFKVWVTLPLCGWCILLGHEMCVPSTYRDVPSSFLSFGKCDRDASILGWENLSDGARQIFIFMTLREASKRTVSSCRDLMELTDWSYLDPIPLPLSICNWIWWKNKPISDNCRAVASRSVEVSDLFDKKRLSVTSEVLPRAERFGFFLLWLRSHSVCEGLWTKHIGNSVGTLLSHLWCTWTSTLSEGVQQ